MGTVFDHAGKTIRKVRNLAWLVRNARHATDVQVLPPANPADGEALLRVWFDPSLSPSGAYRFDTSFGSVALLWQWLRVRRSLYHCSLRWGTEPEGSVARMGEYPGPPDERSGYGECPSGSASGTGGQCCRCDRCMRARERYTLAAPVAVEPPAPPAKVDPEAKRRAICERVGANVFGRLSHAATLIEAERFADARREIAAVSRFLK